ncbi:MAG: hypothetical protein JO110_04780 [Acetobacteraceae bacterium]|nr:hypothetical protein [Acetobacteraceae bacterium]
MRSLREEIQAELRSVRQTHEGDFRLTWAGLILGFLALGGMMARGFHWF